MPDARVVEWIREKYVDLVGELDERGRRRWAATELRSLGWGGVSAVAAATGMSDRTIRNGIAELDAADRLPADRQGGPAAVGSRGEQEQPGLIDALERLVEPDTRGDPQSPLRWTCKSTRNSPGFSRRKGFRSVTARSDTCSRQLATACKPIARRGRVISIRIGTASFATSRSG